MKTDFDAIIVGGGLAGLTSSILLALKGKAVLLIEKKSYPFHKVCGEYVSNEVLNFLQSLGFNPFDYGASRISRLRISTPAGKNIFPALGLGGFGISRYVMDDAMYKIALQSGVQILCNERVNEILFLDNIFHVKTNSNTVYTSKLAVGCYGKRDTLDKKLNRRFIRSRTRYMGVKYHVRTDYPADEIGLDNFNRGYCGIVRVENGIYNICYLYRRSVDNTFNSVKETEENVLFKNPVIKNIFSNSEFLFDTPLVINEISFEAKNLIENRILMCGDSAGLITPLCGNGMSMSIHAAKILCNLIIDSGILNSASVSVASRNRLEENYRVEWERNFRRRLLVGRTIQRLFGNPVLTGAGMQFIHTFPSLEKWLVAGTHGKTIDVN